MLPKVVHILLKINLHDFCPFWVWYFCYWYSVIYWNQMGIVCWKWIVIFVMVISVPVSHEHWDATVLMILQEIKMYVYSWGLRLLGYNVASVGNWLHLRGMAVCVRPCSDRSYRLLCWLHVSYVNIEWWLRTAAVQTQKLRARFRNVRNSASGTQMPCCMLP